MVGEGTKGTGTVAPVNVLFVATVQEEIGFKGMSYYMDHMPVLPDMVIAVDAFLGELIAGAMGVKWIKATFTTPGGHTLWSTGQPSAVKSLAAGITAAYEYQVEQTPSINLNCGVIGGGTVPNAIASEAWTTIDMRSQDPAALQTLFDNVVGAMKEAAADTDAKFSYELMNDLPSDSGRGRACDYDGS